MYKSAKLLLFFIVTSAQSAISQTVSTDSLVYERSIQASQNTLADTLETGLNLYNGIEHRGYYRGVKGLAYLESEQMTEGSVQYDSVWYKIPMLYDLYTERLIIMHFDRFYRIALINEKVKEFVLHGRIFRNLPEDTTMKNGLTGICEVLYEGDSISVFAKKRKLLNERSTSQRLEQEFVNKNLYYVLLDDTYFRVNSKGDLIELMGNSRKRVSTELRRMKIKFRKNKERAIITASKIYDEKI